MNTDKYKEYYIRHYIGEEKSTVRSTIFCSKHTKYKTEILIPSHNIIQSTNLDDIGEDCYIFCLYCLSEDEKLLSELLLIDAIKYHHTTIIKVVDQIREIDSRANRA